MEKSDFKIGDYTKYTDYDQYDTQTSFVKIIGAHKDKFDVIEVNRSGTMFNPKSYVRMEDIDKLSKPNDSYKELLLKCAKKVIDKNKTKLKELENSTRRIKNEINTLETFLEKELNYENQMAENSKI